MPENINRNIADIASRLAPVLERAAATEDRPLVVGLTGPVAVGKSTFADELAERLVASGLETAVVPTDGFLLANAELDARGLTMRKGFPESFDTRRFSRFLADARGGAAELRMPRYSHLTYDVTGEEAVIPAPDVLIVEGVNVLLPEHVANLDLSIYLDAPEEAVVGWFCARLAELCVAARDEPSSFFRPYADLSSEHISAFAHGAWDAINAVNLELHIRPQRERADVVVEKRADHSIGQVTFR
jgi:type I pantothenate kinase